MPPKGDEKNQVSAGCNTKEDAAEYAKTAPASARKLMRQPNEQRHAEDKIEQMPVEAAARNRTREVVLENAVTHLWPHTVRCEIRDDGEWRNGGRDEEDGRSFRERAFLPN